MLKNFLAGSKIARFRRKMAIIVSSFLRFCHDWGGWYKNKPTFIIFEVYIFLVKIEFSLTQ